MLEEAAKLESYLDTANDLELELDINTAGLLPGEIRSLLRSTDADVASISVELRKLAAMRKEDMLAHLDTLAVLDSQRKALTAMLWDDRRENGGRGYGI